MKSLNILFISDIYPPYVEGGAEVSTSLLVNALANRNHKCYVLTTRILKKTLSNTSNIEYLPALIIPFLKEENNKPYRYRILPNLGYHIYNFAILFATILKTNFDIIHAVPLSYATLPVLLAALISNKPVVLDVRGYLFTPHYLNNSHSEISHNISFYRFLGKKYETYSYYLFLMLVRILIKFKKSIAIVALSEYIKNVLISNKFPPNKIKVVYNIAPKLNKFGKTYDREKGVVFAGILENTKGVWDAIKAIEILNDPLIQLHILGTGSNFKKIQEYIYKNNITNIYLHGKVDQNKVIDFYLKNKIIIAPSTWPEPFGRFIQEASATQTPIITTEIGGIPECITNNVNGILVQPGRPDQLATAISLLLRNKKLYETISTNICQLSNKFSEEIIVNKREYIYKILLSQSFNK